MAREKKATSVGSAPADPNKNSATVAPIPTPVLANKPAPGQRGPVGMAPRTTYSRVNSGLPPTLDAGGMAQKGSPNRGLEQLPAKVASTTRSSDMTDMHTRPLLQDMVKAAMAGAVNKMATTVRASRQPSGSVKTASAGQDEESSPYPTHRVVKLASALSYIADQIVKEAEEGPGTGPNALGVSQSDPSGESLQPGGAGKATGGNQPPTSPSTQGEEVQTGKANTGLDTNDDSMPPSENAGITNSKTAGKKKESSAPMDYIRAKLAEDAINPAKIDGGGTVDPAKPPPGASASEEDVPSEPGDVSRQKGMIRSNEAAINYTKRDAKADPKSDVAQTLDEPPLSASTDPVLQKTLDHTSSAGVKISSAKSMAKTAQQVGAQRVILRRLLSKVAEESHKTASRGA